MTLQHARERLTLALVALLPLHALFITVATRISFGPGNPPYSLLSLWKEGLLGVILALSALEIIRGAEGRRQRTEGGVQNSVWALDRVDGLIIGLIAWSVFASLVAHGSLSLVALGFRYDFVPLVAFCILRRTEWSEWFRTRVVRVVLFGGATVAAYALLTMVLPMSFFTTLGYSELHSLYLPDKPLAAFQQIAESSIRRVQGPMSGPNQLGLWLLLPLAALLATWRTRGAGPNLLLIIALVGALFFSFSRSAWVAAFGMTCVAAWLQFGGYLSRRAIVSGVLAVMLLGVIAVLSAPSALIRLSSSRGHVELPLQAIETMARNPLGLGLGTAGPASNRTSEACVKLRPQDDPSWAKDRPDLCVFVGEKQVQPLDHDCKCPLLTENWYLQIGVEAGVVGFLLFLAIVASILWRLWLQEVRRQKSEGRGQDAELGMVALFAFIGLCIGSMFLHAWEDAAVAWTVCLLLSLSLAPHGAFAKREPSVL